MSKTKTPYQDNAGRPCLRPSITGFVDMLGFSSMSVSTSDAVESQHLLERIAGAVESARAIVHDYFSTAETSTVPTGWAVKYFSDNLVLGCPTATDGTDLPRIAAFVIRCAQRYQLQMAQSGFFIRGALTHGLICLTDEIIFGPTLIESYTLEAKTAVVPRLLVSKPLQEAVQTLCNALAKGSSDDVDNLICQDVDGWWFVNYLQAAVSEAGVDWSIIARHKESILASLASTTRHEVLPKYGWACRYHNVFCHWHYADPNYLDKHRIDRVDEQSSIRR
ncbi:MAG TPA: hypothetical protein VL096_13475, partial [Pirellulaceae bacterium]|nr:hypothetical protein [Pirellulaceae bacterium]